MRIIHRIGRRLNVSERAELAALGLQLPDGLFMPGGGDPLYAFDVAEDHANWIALENRFRELQTSDVVRTEFSDWEVANARWLKLVADWHHGYPQPHELDFGYLKATYDLADYCQECGVGKVQKAPFQMKDEPKWGRRSILQLNWVFDQYFVTPEVWESVFRSHGIGYRVVLNTKGAQLKTVVQLTTEEQVHVNVTGLASETCAHCGQVKYLPHTRGFFPRLLGEPVGAIARTREYFGSGASAYSGVVVSQGVVRDLKAANVRGVSFKPLVGG